VHLCTTRRPPHWTLKRDGRRSASSRSPMAAALVARRGGPPWQPCRQRSGRRRGPPRTLLLGVSRRRGPAHLTRAKALVVDGPRQPSWKLVPCGDSRTEPAARSPPATSTVKKAGRPPACAVAHAVVRFRWPPSIATLGDGKRCGGWYAAAAVIGTGMPWRMPYVTLHAAAVGRSPGC